MDDNLALAFAIPCQALRLLVQERDVQMAGSSAEGYEAARVAGASNIEAEADGAPGLFSLGKRWLRGEFNCCLPLPEVGKGKRGHSQTLLRGNDYWVQKGKFWLYV